MDVVLCLSKKAERGPVYIQLKLSAYFFIIWCTFLAVSVRVDTMQTALLNHVSKLSAAD